MLRTLYQFSTDWQKKKSTKYAYHMHLAPNSTHYEKFFDYFNSKVLGFSDLTW